MYGKCNCDNASVSAGIFWGFLWAVQAVLIVLKFVGVEPFVGASWMVILIPFWMWLTVFVLFWVIMLSIVAYITSKNKM